MKRTICVLSLLMILINASAQEKKKNDTLLLKPIEIISVRAGDKAPFTKTDISKETLEKINLGQDLPFILNQIPGAVVNSDAGNGVGYTGIRIRGTDQTRINVTLNGIPYNDAESQGTYFVDVPDITSSINSIQVQRGVGTSSNGAGAFGASINISTNELTDSFYAQLNNTYGSFNTWKHTLKVGSGLLGGHFTIDGRLSKISSDGYVDRAFTDLKSGYISAAYVDRNNSLRLNVFSGREKTYQAWYGIPESYLNTDRTFNFAGTEKPGTPYDNETDNYTQSHYQLFYNHRINNNWGFNTAVFYTKGAGFYEEYRAGQKFSDYGLPDYFNGTTLVTSTDLIRQLWLDNDFYGTIFSLQHHNARSQLTFGGGWNQYDGKHYGTVTWAEFGFPKDYRFYNLDAHKKDLNIYSKLQQTLLPNLQWFADAQIRTINYGINGFESNPQLIINKNYFFFNPKTGITYLNNNFKAYLSYAKATHEPNRTDFEAGTYQQPKPETLHDFEIGIQRSSRSYSYGVTGFYMLYHNQLVLTGKINDVGAYTRTNIANSYRKGIEAEGMVHYKNWLSVSGNVSFSENKIKNFVEYIDDYDNGGQKVNNYTKTNISFSPSIVGSGIISLIPVKNSEISFISKYVGRQFLDNTSNISRSLHPYFVQDARVSYVTKKIFKEATFTIQLNNIFNAKYEPNGYTFSYFYNAQLTTENYYFPMAGRNVLIAIGIKI